jgi:hypothetical protein
MPEIFRGFSSFPVFLGFAFRYRLRFSRSIAQPRAQCLSAEIWVYRQKSGKNFRKNVPPARVLVAGDARRTVFRHGCRQN